MPRTRFPVITLPTDNPTRIAQLTAKLDEYRQRYDQNRAPALQMGTLMKTLVLETLLQQGRVEARSLSRTLAKRFGPAFNLPAFTNACAVIRDYCTTGGQRLYGGTGLPSISP